MGLKTLKLRYWELLLIGFGFVLFFVSFLLPTYLVFSLLTIYTVVYLGFERQYNLSNPKVVLTVFIYIYSIWFPLQTYLAPQLALLPFRDHTLKQTILVSWFFLSCFQFFSAVFIKDQDPSFAFKSYITQKIYLSERLIVLFIGGAVLLLLIGISNSGAKTKLDLAAEAGSLVDLSQFLLLLLSIIWILHSIKSKNLLRRLDTYLLIAYFTLAYLLSGHRDLLFRALFISTLVFFDYRGRISSLSLYSIVFMIIAIVPISQLFKSAFISEGLMLQGITLNILLTNEFISAGRNLYSLLYFGSDLDIYSLLSNLMRSIIPNIITGLFGVKFESAVYWFHTVYRVEHGFAGRAGWGFSFVAHGWLVGRYFGVMIFALLYSGLVCHFYNLRVKSVYFYTFYLLLVTTSIYVLRADLSNFLSQAFKINGVLLGFVWLAHKFLVRIK